MLSFPLSLILLFLLSIDFGYCTPDLCVSVQRHQKGFSPWHSCTMTFLCAFYETFHMFRI